MGFWRDFLIGPTPTVVGPLTPFSPQDSLTSITIADLWHGQQLPTTITREIALRIPAVKRAHDITCSVVSRMPWKTYAGEQAIEQQPRWLVTSDTGIAPRNLRWGVVSDLFFYGWAALVFKLEDGYPTDALHIPFDWWNAEADGTVTLDDRVPAGYRGRVVPISLGYGSNGILVDGVDSMRASRVIEAAYRDRIENPIAQTILTLAADRWDGWNREERESFRKQWIAGRSAAGGATAMKPDWVTVDFPSSIPADLFESGRNAARLDIANHAGIPASLLEGSKQSGGGDIHYSTEAGGATRNELWDFGLAKYADAIEARLSLDDVCRPGQSIRVDPSAYLVSPNPTTPITSED